MTLVNKITQVSGVQVDDTSSIYCIVFPTPSARITSEVTEKLDFVPLILHTRKATYPQLYCLKETKLGCIPLFIVLRLSEISFATPFPGQRVTTHDYGCHWKVFSGHGHNFWASFVKVITSRTHLYFLKFYSRKRENINLSFHLFLHLLVVPWRGVKPTTLAYGTKL